MSDLLDPEDLYSEKRPAEDGWVDLPLARQASSPDEPAIARPLPRPAGDAAAAPRARSSGLGWWILLLVLLLPIGIYAGYRWNLAPPVVVAAEPWLDFGEVKVGAEGRELHLELGNGGEQPLQLAAPSLAGEHAADFEVVDSSCGAELAPQGRCALRLLATPSDLGLRKASLRLEGNAANSPLNVALIVAGTRPRLSVAPLEADFGRLLIGSSSELATFELRNIGDATLELGAIEYDGLGRGSGDFIRQRDDCSQRRLEPGASCSLSFRFIPTEAGERSARLRIRSDLTDPAPAPRLIGSGLAPKPRLVLADTALDFGLWPVGEETEAQPLTLRNGGTVPLRITEIVAAADSPFRVAGADCLSRPLQPAAACRVEIRFQPRDTRPVEEELEIRHDGEGGAETVSLTGSGSSPDFAVQPLRLAFGETPVGELSPARRITFTNPGNADLAISLSLDGGDASAFAVHETSCEKALEPAESCAVEVRFRPRRNGPQRAELVVRHNAGSGSERLALSGIGVRARLAINPGQIDFGGVELGSAARREILLANTGRAAVTVRRIRLQGSQTAAFTLDTAACLGRRLDPGRSCRVIVAFRPDTVGSSDAQVLIESSLDDGQDTVQLRAIGLESPS